MIKVEHIRKFCEFEKLKESWNKLRKNQVSEDLIFIAHEWFDCWWRCYSDEAQLFILVAKEDDQLLGIAPFMLKKDFLRGLPIKLLSFIDNGNSGHNNFIIEGSKKREVLEALFLYLRINHKAWDVLELKRIPPESDNFKFLQEALQSQHMPFIAKAGTNAPYLRIEHDWQKIYASLSGKKKKTLRNVQNRMSREGNFAIRAITDFNDYQVIQPHLLDIARNSWSARTKSSLTRPENRRFIDELSHLAANKGWLLIWILYLRSKPIAFEYHLRYGNRVHGIRSSFNKNFGHLSPGAFLDFHIMRNYFERRDIAEYDMGGNADFYKRQWTKDVRQHTTFHVFSLNPYSKMIYFYESFLEKILKRSIRCFLSAV